MITASVTEFGLDINKYLDKIESENETLFIERNNGAGSIVISSQEYFNFGNYAPTKLKKER